MAEDRGTTGTINLSQNVKEETINISGQIHHLPCYIKFNGPCSVSQYFKPKLKGKDIDGLTVKEAHFRGRKLQGTTISLPNGYSGFVLTKKTSGKRKACDVSEENSNNWEMKAMFDELTYWNHDSLPSKDDPFLRSFHWFAVAEALHKPVKAEDLATVDAAPGRN
ncbi:ribonuclease H2 subunit C-like isoform X1 [Hibiscus syriacus]|uniref:ribonuclease H2 subunit C-like isoform X1 n=1 Tax=Hibiscus syriacus TaxID=106335 RepID=UPI001920DABE|nr:ribonuclease H2 subunit C-like isoform X1 [Hibiscus syriacus]